MLTGFDLISMAYQKNARFFTFGQGGYFSPQNFIHIGIPVRWTGGSTLKWNVVVIPGFNWFRENASQYFPTDTGMQAGRTDAVTSGAQDPNGTALLAMYPARTAAGFALDLRGQLTYPLTRDLEIGADLQFHRADDYQEFIAGVVVKFAFQRSGLDLSSRYK